MGLAQLRWDVARVERVGPFSDMRRGVVPRLCSSSMRTVLTPNEPNVRISQKIAKACPTIVGSQPARLGQAGADPTFAAAGYPIPVPGPDHLCRIDVRRVLEEELVVKSQAGGKRSANVGSALAYERVGL